MELSKEYEVLSVLNENDRRFKGWASVEIADKQGEIIPIDEMKEGMNTWMARGAPMTDGHSNRVVARGLNWGLDDKDGKKGIWVEGMVYRDWSIDNDVWNKIKSKPMSLSFGGRTTKKAQTLIDPKTGVETKVLHGIENYEIAIVDKPANPEATIEAINPLAKADKDYKSLIKDVFKDEWDKERKEHPKFTDEQIDQIVADHKKNEIEKMSLPEKVRDIYTNAEWNKMTPEEQKRILEGAGAEKSVEKGGTELVADSPRGLKQKPPGETPPQDDQAKKSYLSVIKELEIEKEVDVFVLKPCGFDMAGCIRDLTPKYGEDRAGAICQASKQKHEGKE